MKPGTLVVVEPIAGEDPHLAAQVAGLVAVTYQSVANARGSVYWSLRPAVIVDVPAFILDGGGNVISPGRKEVALHQAWLRPLDPPPRADDTPTKEPINVHEVAHA